MLSFELYSKVTCGIIVYGKEKQCYIKIQKEKWAIKYIKNINVLSNKIILIR